MDFMKQRVVPHQIFCIYKDPKGRRLYTKSLLKPAQSHFGERLVKEGGEVYREWEAKRSKLAATVMNGCSNTGIREGSTVLYLGASHGFTPSFVSDMIGREGFMFALDFSPEVTRDLVFLAEERENIAPILGDANQPESYADKVSQVDVVFQDVAQKNQAEIFLKNCRLFLKEGGFGLLAIKARSIDIKRKAKEICQEVRDLVEKEFMVVDFRDLAPHEKEHYMLVIKKRPPVEEVKKANAKKNAGRVKGVDFTHRREGKKFERRERKSGPGSRDGSERSDRRRSESRGRNSTSQKRGQKSRSPAPKFVRKKR